jgi:uncharacterized membrane protein YqjE
MTDVQRTVGDERHDPGQPLRPERSLPELLSDLTGEFTTLVRKELELAKVEAKDEARDAARAGGMLGAGGLAAWLGVLFVSLAAAWLLDQAVNRALAFGIVALVWLVAAAILISLGRRRLSELQVIPQTKETLQEDVEWARAQKT